MKKVISLLIVISMLFASTPSVFAANKSENNKINVKSYVAWLESQSMSKSLSEESIIKEFQALSNDQQKTFVSYFNDKELMQKVAEAIISGEDASLADGDILISTSEPKVFDDTMTLAAADVKKATYNRWLTFLGVKVFETELGVRYYKENGKITEVISGYAEVIKNWVPGADADFTGEDSYLSGGKAYTEALLKFSMIWDGLGLVVDTVDCYMSVDSSGKVKGWTQ